MKKYTQKEKLLVVMLRRRHEQKWFYAPDFQKPNMDNEVFVGYEATARISELYQDFPDLIEMKREGKYRYIRIRYENLDGVYSKLPNNVKLIFTDNGYLPKNMPLPLGY